VSGHSKALWDGAEEWGIHGKFGSANPKERDLKDDLEVNGNIILK
jgi:hypothetical protein